MRGFVAAPPPASLIQFLVLNVFALLVCGLPAGLVVAVGERSVWPVQAVPEDVV